MHRSRLLLVRGCANILVPPSRPAVTITTVNKTTTAGGGSSMFRNEYTTTTTTEVSGDHNVTTTNSSAVMKEKNHRKLIVLSGPSGGGKSTLLNRLLNEYPNCFSFSVSHTTRVPRPGEQHGKDYYFVTRDEMLKAIEDGKFLEHAEFGGNIYGTSVQAVRDVQSTGRICILDVEIQGVRSIRKTDLNPRYIFVKPPSVEVLEQRLRARGTETEESLKKRLDRARIDLKEVEDEPRLFDHVIINDDLEIAYKHFLSVLKDDLLAFCNQKRH